MSDYPSTVLALLPKAYWRLGETSGTNAADSGTNGIDGTYSGVTLNQASLLVGDANPSAGFNGTSSKVTIGTQSALNISGAITLSGLVQLSAFPGNTVLWNVLAKGYDNAVVSYYWDIRGESGVTNMHVGCYRVDTNTVYEAVVDISAWDLNTPYHVVGQYTGTAWKLFVNATEVASTTTANGAQSGTAPLIIGAFDFAGSVSRFFSGLIDEIAIWDSSLSAGNITSLAIAAGVIAPTSPTFTAAVNSNGAKLDLTFSTSVTGVAADDYLCVADGRKVTLSTVTGSGTSWSIALASSWIVSGEVVKLTSYGTGTIDGSSVPVAQGIVSVTNNSIVTEKQRKYVTQYYGMFLVWGMATFVDLQLETGGEDVDDFAPTTDAAGMRAAAVQWATVAKDNGFTYIVFVTQSVGGFCLWDSAATDQKISNSAWSAQTGIKDIVKLFVDAARDAGLGIGLYMLPGDYFYRDYRLAHGGTGTQGTFDGTYKGRNITQYNVVKYTELLSNYGKIDVLWHDLWNYSGYTNPDYATIRALVTSLQPECVFVENSNTSALTHSDIWEIDDDVDSEPSSSNVIPGEYCAPTLANQHWFWNTGDVLYKDPLAIAKQIKRIRKARFSYLLDCAPDTSGRITTENVTFLTSLTQMIGSVPPYAQPADVREDVDRGDGVLGTFEGTGGGGGGGGPVTLKTITGPENVGAENPTIVINENFQILQDAINAMDGSQGIILKMISGSENVTQNRTAVINSNFQLCQNAINS